MLLAFPFVYGHLGHFKDKELNSGLPRTTPASSQIRTAEL